MTLTQAPQYRKTKSGQWVVFGPADSVHVGSVTVAKRDGRTKTEMIEKVGKDFVVDGVTCRYGYIVQRESAARTGGRCSGSCRCHREANAGQPGSILYDGCDRCGCEAC